MISTRVNGRGQLPGEALRSAAVCIISLWVCVAVAGCEEPGSIIRLDEARGDPTRGVAPTTEPPRASDEDLNPRLLRRFAAIAPAVPENPARVALGRILYFEPLLSRTELISCNSCHPLESYGTTSSPVAIGVDGHRGVRNAPSTYNVSGHFRMFWDGRTESLEEQVRGPLESHDEMDMSADAIVRRLDGIPGYTPLFASAFPGERSTITIENISQAVAAFERGLVTPARWDRYLNGDRDALQPGEKAGAKLFANVGCMVCHTGPLLGATTFEKLGVRVPWPQQPDRGRRNVSGDVADDLQFKVPSLRNVTRTAPYFHDGSVTDLSEAVVLMARHQLGLELLPDESQSIVTFLGCLTGDPPLAYIAPPELPPARRP